MSLELFAPVVVAVARVGFGWRFFGLGADKLRPFGIKNDDYIRVAPWGNGPEEITIWLTNGIADVKTKFHDRILA